VQARMKKIIYKERHLRVLEKGEICCKDITRHFGEVLEGDVPPSLQARLQQHLESCEECQEFTKSYLTTIALAKQLANTAMPEGVQDRLINALNQRLGLQL
jgi:hypothetical protein